MDWSDLTARRGEVVAGRYRLEEALGPARCRALRLDDRKDVWFHRIDRTKTDIDFEKPLPRLTHISVLDLLDNGNLDERWAYILTAPPDGPCLDDMLEEGPLLPNRAIEIITRLAEAMMAMHDAGMILKNLRTADVWLGSRWEAEDRLWIPPHPVLLGPAAGRKLGGYCASEVAPAYAAELDHRADQYSLGVIGFELLTGTTPHNPDAPPGERTVLPVLPHPQVPVSIESVLRRLLGDTPSRRFPDDRAMLAALSNTQAELEPSTSYGQFTPVILPVRNQMPLSIPSIPPAPPQVGSWDDTLAKFLLLLIIFVIVLATSTGLVLMFW